MGEDLQQAYRAANQALEEIPAFEDIPRVDRNTAKELAQNTGNQAVAAFRNSRGAAGTSSPEPYSSASHGVSGNGSKSTPLGSSQGGGEDGMQGSRQSADGASNTWEEGVNAAASRARSAAQQVATAAREEVCHQRTHVSQCAFQASLRCNWYRP